MKRISVLILFASILLIVALVSFINSIATDMLAVVIALFLIILLLAYIASTNKISERKLKEANERYNSLFNNMIEGFALHEIICDDQGSPIDYRFLDVNKSFENMTNLRKEEIINKRVLEILPGTEKYWIEKYGRVALQGESLSFHNYSEEMDKYYIVNAFSPEKGMFAAAFFDITEQKRVEKMLYEEKERFRITLFSVGDGVIVTDINGMITMINGVAQHLTGWIEDEAVGMCFETVFNIINEHSRERCINPVQKVISTGKIIGLANHTILISKDGNECPIADSAAPIIDEVGDIKGVVLVFRDVTIEKQRQANIEYLSYHDYLTGLYNRRFLEEELSRLDTERNLPISIIMGDVNGLKLTNDAFGHAMGDNLLRSATQAIKNGCRSDDIIARQGGDEFIILLPKTNGEEAEQIVKRIRLNCSQIQLNSISLSISFGWDVKYTTNQDIQNVFKSAEDYMYKQKRG